MEEVFSRIMSRWKHWWVKYPSIYSSYESIHPTCVVFSEKVVSNENNGKYCKACLHQNLNLSWSFTWNILIDDKNKINDETFLNIVECIQFNFKTMKMFNNINWYSNPADQIFLNMFAHFWIFSIRCILLKMFIYIHSSLGAILLLS